MRLIDADALIKELKHITDAYGGDDGDAVFTFYDPLIRRNQLVNMEEFIKMCQTIEPTSLARKHGKWMYTSTDIPGLSMNVCSECGFQYPLLLKHFDYCPYCGARMNL